MVVGNRDIAEEPSMKTAFLLCQGFTMSLAFPHPQASVGDSAWSLLGLCHHLCMVTCFYIPTESAGKASYQPFHHYRPGALDEEGREIDN